MSTVLIALSLIPLAFSQEAPPTQAPAAQAPATQAPAPPVVSPGSLWQDNTGRQLMGLQGNARQVGDLVTVVIQEQSTSDLGATTTSNKSSQRSGGIGSLFGLETGITGANANLGGEIGFDVGSDAAFSGGGTTASSVSVAAIVTCEVVGVMPNGNLLISGTKQLRNYGDIQYVTVQGKVRPQDIRMDNTVSSELLANAQIELLGRGSIAERNRPGVGTRLLDVAWPF